jgi:arylesterase/paraoxonase
MRLRTVVLLCLVLLITVTGVFFFTIIRDAGEFKELNYHEPGPCRPVLGVQSSEDITIDSESGVAFISSADRRTSFDYGPAPGAIFGYDLNQMPLQPRNLTPDLPFEFNPHGIGLYRGEAGKRLFVVNHRSDGDTIELFRIEGTSSLIHLESISDPGLFNANDVVAVGERSCFVTIDHGSVAPFWRTLEEWLRLPWAGVFFLGPDSASLVDDSLRMANGINLSPDGTRLYVAATLDFAVHVYERDPVSNAIHRVGTIPTGTGVDNIELGPDGDLIVGAHPKLLAFVEYAGDRRRLSPSQVLRISSPAVPDQATVEELFLGDGRYLSGSSVGAIWKNDLLIGSVFDQRFLLCAMSAP